MHIGFEFVAALLFNCSYWFFAHKYFTTAMQMPYVFYGKPVPKSLEKKMSILLWSVMAFNVIMLIVYSSMLHFEDGIPHAYIYLIVNMG